jgi:hypothetical protein
MAVTDTEKSLEGFLQEHGNNRVRMELLLFWALHPNARFDRRAIGYALDCSKSDTEKGLKAMAEEGLLDENSCNGVTLYSLTTNIERRQPVLELAKLSWHQWQLMFSRVQGERPSPGSARTVFRP